MKQQLDLFNGPASRAAKLDGMERVDRGANPAWSAVMLSHTVRTARSLRYFTSDDVFAVAALAETQETTHDRRAFGPVMMRAAKAGVCRRAERPPINSNRTTLHASPRSVWESLIFEGET